MTQMKQRFAVCVHFTRASGHHFQIAISRMESLFVRSKDLAIIFEQLASDKIEKSSARLACAPNQVDVGVGEIDHSRDVQVRIRALLFNGIQRELPPGPAVIKLQMIVRDEAVGHQTLCAESDQLEERARIRRLETG